MRRLASVILILALSPALAAAQSKAEEKIQKAERDLDRGRLPQAEKHLREAIKADPASLDAHLLLADLLYSQRRFSYAVEPLQKALELAAAQGKLTERRRRIINTQLGISYGLSGKLAAAEQLFTRAIADDPDYALHHYNLACTYAEKGDLERALPHLQAAWERRKNLNPGERFPNPRQDASFRRYADDPRFQDAVRDMVF